MIQFLNTVSVSISRENLNKVCKGKKHFHLEDRTKGEISYWGTGKLVLTITVCKMLYFELHMISSTWGSLKETLSMFRKGSREISQKEKSEWRIGPHT